MKKHLALAIAFGAVTIISSCNTGSAVHDGRDTAKSDYDVRSNVDTSATTQQMSNSTSIDNTASGGVMVHKDTTHMKVRTVAVTPQAPVAVADTTAKKDTSAKPKK